MCILLGFGTHFLNLTNYLALCWMIILIWFLDGGLLYGSLSYYIPLCSHALMQFDLIVSDSWSNNVSGEWQS